MLNSIYFRSLLSLKHFNFELLLIMIIISVILAFSTYRKKYSSKIGLIVVSSILIFSFFFISNCKVKINRIGGVFAYLPSLNFVESNISSVKSDAVKFNSSDNIYKTMSSSNKKQTSLNEKIAEAYGVNAFSKVKKIDYTFNVEFGGKKFSRKWEWYPKTKEITYWGKNKNGKDETLTYNRNKKMDEKTKKIDAAFINDNYWLLFPFHLVWDTNVKFTDEGMKKYPIGKGEGRCLAVQYSDKVGYTPGDRFDLYLNKNNMIHQWVYLHGGSTKNPRPATWEGNKNYGGFTISTMHNGLGKKFKLWFSGIKVVFEK